MKIALITGALGGLASEIINLIKNDFIIYALDINPLIKDKYKEKSIIPVVCDITKTDELKKLYDELKNGNIRLDLIINFAGIVALGSTIEIDPSILKKVLDINLIGVYNVNNCFYDLLNPASRIINVSSEYGKIDAIPFHSFYTLSKHALEIYNDSLRRELLNTKIKVIKIRPGSFKTNMQNNINNQFDDLVANTTHYKTPLLKMKSIMTKELLKAKDTKKIRKVFKKAIYKKKPKLAYNVNNSFKMKLYSILPAKLQDFFFKIYFK